MSVPFGEFRRLGEEAGDDGRSLYRALARQAAGDPTKFMLIMDQVFDHFLRVFVNPEHPLHSSYKSSNDSQPIIPYLSRPDTATNEASVDRLFTIMSNALRVCIHRHTNGPPRIFNFGVWPEHHVQMHDGSYISLLRDETGNGLISFMLDVKAAIASEQRSRWDDLELKELRWWWSCTATLPWLRPTDVRCWSEYSPTNVISIRHDGVHYDSPPLVGEPFDFADYGTTWDIPQDNPNYKLHWAPTEDKRDMQVDWSALETKTDGEFTVCTPRTPLRFKVEAGTGKLYIDTFQQSPRSPTIFPVFTVSVSRPSQIRSVVDLIFEAVKYSPAQGIPVNMDLSSAVSSKGKLKPYIAVDAEFKKVPSPDDYQYAEDESTRFKEERSNNEELCTVLTIAVDRHVVISFYLLHLLQNAEEDTVSELSYLFEQVIFNPDLLKIWFNYQSDIYVIDSTIAHMYQGTARKEFKTEPWRNRPLDVKPVWKIKNSYFTGERPSNLTFSGEDDDCPFHKPVTYPRAIACPCRYGNLDITTILAFLRKELGMGDLEETRTSWRRARHGFRYEKALDTFLGNDWIFPILKWFKDAPERAAHDQAKGKEEFYYSLGPGMETDCDKMGYNIGDVVGINLIFRFLTTTDDRVLLAGRLYKMTDRLYIPERQVHPENPPTRPSKDLGIPLLEDNPRVWSTNKQQLIPKVDDLWYGGNKRSRWTMEDASYIAHEERVKEAKANWEARRRQGPRQAISWNVKDYIHRTLIDPCKFVLPTIFANAPPELEGVDGMSGPKRVESMTPPVVRSSQSHTFSLLEAIRESANSVAPRGLMDLPSEEDSNVLTDEIKAAFEQDSKIESAPAFFKRVSREAARNTRDTSKARSELEAIRDLVAPLTDPYAPNGEDVSWDLCGEDHASHLAKTVSWNQPASFRNRPKWNKDIAHQTIQEHLTELDRIEGRITRPGFSYSQAAHAAEGQGHGVPPAPIVPPPHFRPESSSPAQPNSQGGRFHPYNRSDSARGRGRASFRARDTVIGSGRGRGRGRGGLQTPARTTPARTTPAVPARTQPKRTQQQTRTRQQTQQQQQTQQTQQQQQRSRPQRHLRTIDPGEIDPTNLYANILEVEGQDDDDEMEEGDAYEAGGDGDWLPERHRGDDDGDDGELSEQAGILVLESPPPRRKRGRAAGADEGGSERVKRLRRGA